MHVGWLSPAIFLNTAQAIVAWRLLPISSMLSWSLVLYFTAAVLLFAVNVGLRGTIGYIAAVLWGLIGVYAAQSRLPLPGADKAAGVALLLAAAFAAQTVWLISKRRALRTARAG